MSKLKLRTWDEVEKEIFTPQEIEESKARVAIIRELINARNSGKITQKELEEASGIKQPVISRVERGLANPQLDTIIKLLAPLGKTLAVVPIDKSNIKQAI